MLQGLAKTNWWRFRRYHSRWTQGGLQEETSRLKLNISVNFGYRKHANNVNLLDSSHTPMAADSTNCRPCCSVTQGIRVAKTSFSKPFVKLFNETAVLKATWILVLGDLFPRWCHHKPKLWRRFSASKYEVTTTRVFLLQYCLPLPIRHSGLHVMLVNHHLG